MSMPPLRQPKLKPPTPELPKKPRTPEPPELPMKSSTSLLGQTDEKQLIVSLKSEQKLVVSSDAYHGIVAIGDRYKCVFCEVFIRLDAKAPHTTAPKHVQLLKTFPHLEEFPDHLVRKLKDASYFCTTCNLVVSPQHAPRHLITESHIEQLHRAMNKAQFYKPVQPVVAAGESASWPHLAGSNSGPGVKIPNSSSLLVPQS